MSSSNLRNTGKSPSLSRVALAALLATLLLPSTVRPGPNPAFPPDTPEVTELEALALEMLNRSRAEENLPPLAPDQRMASAARQHSEEMRNLNYMDHVSPVERYRTWTRRLALAEVSDMTTGENVGFFASNSKGLTARNFVETLHRNLMKSPRHRDNILNPKFTTAGIGIALGERPADEDPDTLLPAMWITQNFSGRSVEVDQPAAALTADGLLVVFSGTTEAKRLFLSVRDSRDEPLEELKLEGRRFEKQLVIPFRDEKVRVELCVPAGRNRYDVVNAWNVNTSARPEEAVHAAPADE